ncbi:MAG: GNAT family N-acetyltransferase [Saprospiraceae bacterium]|nr:GNAT family N-acetyltransferase [Saprospiraceae bacterium]
MEIIIRKAQKQDIPAIHALVRELAIYEKAEDQFVATMDEYERDFANNVYRVTVAEAGGKVVGMTLSYMAYSTWKGKMLYLEDFVVYEAYRRFGIGQMLFDAFLEEAREEGCRLVKWQVLDWNEPALKFYQKNNAVIETEWWNGKIFLKD